MTKNNFTRLFSHKPIIGMIHLAGKDSVDRVSRAVEELRIFEEEGIDGAIIENYHGSADDCYDVLMKSAELNYNLVRGVNILPNEFNTSFKFAHQTSSCFIQLDYVSGKYFKSKEIDSYLYNIFRKIFPDVVVLGGVWPKYYCPVKESNLEYDLKEGVERADAIVVTGEGTGKETPINKIKQFRKIIGDYPLIVGAGLTPENAYGQLSIADGAVVGSCLKPENKTSNPVDRKLVRNLMDVVRKVRE
ncbi:MAG: BtpA/SgcQ family protein [Nanoarchaeota archaeon]